DEAEDNLLSVALDAGEVHAVLDDGDDESADEGAEDFAGTTGEGRAANDHGGDDVELVHQAVGGRAAFELRGHHDAAEAGQRAADRIDEQEDALDADAGKAGGFRVAADGVDMAAEDGMSHQEMGGEIESGHQPYGIGEAERGAAAEPDEGVGDLIDG